MIAADAGIGEANVGGLDSQPGSILVIAFAIGIAGFNDDAIEMGLGGWNIYKYYHVVAVVGRIAFESYVSAEDGLFCLEIARIGLCVVARVAPAKGEAMIEREAH